MTAAVLVAYATKYGSTQEVAEAIAQELINQGFTVELQPARSVRSLQGYQAVVLGAPLYMFRWHKDAHGFLGRHRKALEVLPAAVFALGPWNNKEEELQSARDQLDKELEKYPWLRSLNVKVFVGKYDPAKLSFPHNLIPAMKSMPYQDDRDWEAIRAWAEEVAGRLPVQKVPG